MLLLFIGKRRIFVSMELVKLKISQLEPNKGQIDGLPKNPRQIKKKRLELLSQNLEQLPEMLQARPLIVYICSGSSQ